MSMLFDRYASEEFDSNYDDCLEDIKKQLAVRKRGTNKVLYYIYGEYMADAVAEQYCMSLEKIRRGVTVDELEDLWEKLQEILF